MARRNNNHRRNGFTIPVSIVAGFLPIIGDVGVQLKNGDIKQAGQVAIHNLVGFNPWTGKWDMAGLKTGLFPIIAGIIFHKVVGGMLGLNRALAASRIPFIRI